MTIPGKMNGAVKALTNMSVNTCVTIQKSEAQVFSNILL